MEHKEVRIHQPKSTSGEANSEISLVSAGF
jgi:hypothetical protein